MRNLSEMFKDLKDGNGRTTITLLIDAAKKEADHLEDMNGVSATSEKGFIACGAGLEGETAEQKTDDYCARVAVLQDVDNFIKNTNLAMNKQLPNFNNYDVKAVAGAKLAGCADTTLAEIYNKAPDVNFVATPYAMKAALKLLSEPTLAPFAEGKSLHKADPMERSALLFNTWKAAGELFLDTNDLIPLLKVTNFTTPMPIDNVGMPYRAGVRVLDYWPIRTEDRGSQIFYQQANYPEFGTGPGDVRDRNAQIDEGDFDWTSERKDKYSVALFASIARETVHDNVSILARFIDQVVIYLRSKVLWHIFRGNDNAGNPGSKQWHGILDALTDVNADRKQVAPVSSTAEDPKREPLRFLEELFAELWNRDTEPSALFVTTSDFAVIRDSQRHQFGGQFDYTRFPTGQVHGVPMVPTRYMRANNAVMGNFSPESINVVLGDGWQMSMSDEVRFRENQLAVRGAVYGNLEYLQPYNFIKATDTNNWEAARF